ncbi:adenylate kinase family protein [Halosegnis sp.]|uniref:adenylate kinase family protein n=1 Tax=Halosegnis sp. TaxID=2864959 RepID=UPI0035D3F355
MRVAVTGTPGTGKTTATKQVETDLTVVHLNDVIEREGYAAGTDEKRGSVIADTDAVAAWLNGREDLLVESHLAHHFPADRVIVLRCHPADIERRLTDRGDSEQKARENAEAEALDVVLSEAVAEHGADSVYEVDTTDRDPGDVAAAIESVIAGERDPAVGTVDFMEYL